VDPSFQRWEREDGPPSRVLHPHARGRAEYYKKIAEATSANDLSCFVAYAAAGLRDGLQGVFETIQQSLFAISWENYVHEEIGGLKEQGNKDTKIRRLRSLALAMPSDRSVAFGDVALLTPKVAKEYSKMSKPTLSRDLSLLTELKLIVKDDAGYRANISTLRSFTPAAAGRIGERPFRAKSPTGGPYLHSPLLLLL
jgi:hypothetical protein